jgi:hypothetical protein
VRSVEALTTQVLPGIIVDNHSLLGVVGIVGADVVLKGIYAVEAKATNRTPMQVP